MFTRLFQLNLFIKINKKIIELKLETHESE